MSAPSGAPPTPPSPPAASPPTPPTDAAADAARGLADAAKSTAERVPPDSSPEEPSTPDASRSLTEGTPREGATERGRAPIGDEWTDEDDVDRETVTHVYHVPVRSEPPPTPRYDDEDDGIGIGGFGGLVLRGSTLNRNPSLWIGARGAIIFGRRFAIGGAFYEATARFGGPIRGSRGEELGMRAAYGGATIDWTVWRKNRATVGVETLMGAGAACISRSPTYTDSNWRCIETVKMFVVEPGVNFAFEVNDWLRVGAAAGWRFVARQAWREPNDFSMSGPYLSLNLDVGWFGK